MGARARAHTHILHRRNDGDRLLWERNSSLRMCVRVCLCFCRYLWCISTNELKRHCISTNSGILSHTVFVNYHYGQLIPWWLSTTSASTVANRHKELSRKLHSLKTNFSERELVFLGCEKICHRCYCGIYWQRRNNLKSSRESTHGHWRLHTRTITHYHALLYHIIQDK